MSDNKQLFMFDTSTKDLVTKISNHPVHFFANTIGGVILAANDIQAEYFGASSVSEFLGQCYFDLGNKSEIEAATANNIITINSGVPQLVYETCFDKECLCIKTQLLDANKHTIGIGGLAFYLHQIPLKDIVALISELVCFQPVTDEFKSNYVSNANRFNQLSDQERECLFCLARGMTHKQIADVLRISFHAVEGYVENIKTKLGCCNRSDIVSALFELQTT